MKAYWIKFNSVLAYPIVFLLFNKLIGAWKIRVLFAEKYVRAKNGDRLLDIGCGSADILKYLPDQIEYIGFDVSQQYIDFAIKKFGNRGTFFCKKISREATNEILTFDIVMAHGVLHHLTDSEVIELFQLAKKTLKPEGRLITLDGCYVDKQSIITHFFLKRDRGQYVRTEEDYCKLALSVFPAVKAKIHHNVIRIPYTYLIMECSL